MKTFAVLMSLVVAPNLVSAAIWASAAPAVAITDIALEAREPSDVAPAYVWCSKRDSSACSAKREAEPEAAPEAAPEPAPVPEPEESDDSVAPAYVWCSKRDGSLC